MIASADNDAVAVCPASQRSRDLPLK